jgi:hypothetical protein
LKNARARNEDIVNVGVDGIGISSEHIKLDRAVPFGRLGIAHGGPTDRHSRRNIAGAEPAGDANFGEPSPSWWGWPRKLYRPTAVTLYRAATVRLNS